MKMRCLAIVAISSAQASQLIQVASYNNARHTVYLQTHGKVRLIKKIGLAPCTLGKSWGFTANSVWAIKGCRAIFEVGDGPNGQPPLWMVGTRDSADHSIRLTVKESGKATWSQKYPNGIRMSQCGICDQTAIEFGTKKYTISRQFDAVLLTPISSHGATVRFEKLPVALHPKN